LKRLAHDRVPEHADALDLDLYLVAVGQRDGGLAEDADAGGRPGEDEVPRLEREHGRGVCDDRSHAKDQVAGRRVLQRLAVQALDDAQAGA
jgi:hypothetical protein